MSFPCSGRQSPPHAHASLLGVAVEAKSSFLRCLFVAGAVVLVTVSRAAALVSFGQAQLAGNAPFDDPRGFDLIGHQEQADEYVRVAGDGNGNWIAVWQSSDPLGDTIGPDQDIVTSRSSDDGLTWTYPGPLHSSAVADAATYEAAADGWPAIATNRLGTWIVTWNQSSVGAVVQRSTDNGTSWSEPVLLPELSGRSSIVWTGGSADRAFKRPPLIRTSVR